MEINPISAGLWCVTIGSGIANVAVKDRVFLSRLSNFTMVGSVAADYAVKCAHHPDAAQSVGLLTYGVIGVRTGLILVHDFDDRFRRQLMLSSFGAVACLSIGGQLMFKHGLDLRTVLPLIGGAAGCIADYTKNMVMRRRSFIVVGVASLLFGAMTNNWGLAVKNLIADIGANAYFMTRYKDPWPSLRPVLDKTRDFSRKLLKLQHGA